MQLKNTTANRHRIRLIIQMNLKVTFKAAHGRDGTENMQQPRSDKKIKIKKKERKKIQRGVNGVSFLAGGARKISPAGNNHMASNNTNTPCPT